MFKIKQKNKNNQKKKKMMKKMKRLKQKIQNMNNNNKTNNNEAIWLKVFEFYKRNCNNNNDFIEKYLKNYDKIKNMNLGKIKKMGEEKNFDLKLNDNFENLINKYIN